MAETLTLTFNEEEITSLLGALQLTMNELMANYNSETPENQKTLVEEKDQLLAIQTKLMNATWQ